MEHGFAVALETEMARLDHPGVNGPHRHFVDGLAFHRVEIHHGGLDGERIAFPCILAGLAGMESHGFEPGMAFGAKAPLFGDFPLKEVGLGTGGGQGRKGLLGKLGADHPEPMFSLIGENRIAAQSLINAETGQARSLFHLVADGLLKGVKFG